MKAGWVTVSQITQGGRKSLILNDFHMCVPIYTEEAKLLKTLNKIMTHIAYIYIARYVRGLLYMRGHHG